LERRYSSQSVSNEQQSEVTEHPPNLYRVPKINIPDNLHDVAKLVQSELQKNRTEPICNAVAVGKIPRAKNRVGTGESANTTTQNGHNMGGNNNPHRRLALTITKPAHNPRMMCGFFIG